jgi:hypothetical protein
METKLKFKVGDKVRVRSLEWYNSAPKDKYGVVRLGYGWEFIQEMVQYCGKVLKISRINVNAYKVDDIPYHWQDWMLEDEVVTEEKQEVEQLNNNYMETKEMTKEQIFEYLKDSKIICTSTQESTKVQEKLFELGVEFLVSGKRVINTFLLLIDGDNKIAFTHDIEVWVESKYKQIKTNEVLAIKIKEEEKPKFDPSTLQPFDKVLVRQGKHVEWVARFFDFCEDDNYYTTSGSAWVICIPYNEETKHLHGTAEEEPEFYNIWE